MRSRYWTFWGAVLLTAGTVRAQGIVVTLSPPQPFHSDPQPAVSPAPSQPFAITLGRPQPLGSPSNNIQPVSAIEPARPFVARAQTPDIPPVPVNPFPPPPPPPGGVIGGPAPPGVGVIPGQEAYNAGVVNSDADLTWWSRFGQRIERCWDDVTTGVSGVFGGSEVASGRTRFQSDHGFDHFASPVSNPIYFEDPRALTELRPFFIWQKTRNSTPGFAGGSNYFANLQARVALTENISIVINKLGWVWTNANQPGYHDVQTANGFQDLYFGPKFTIYRNQTTLTVIAVGANIELAVGDNRVLNGTGNLSISPYLSLAQNFLKSDYGSFNFMTTVGYAQSLDNRRTDFFFNSLHLDFDVGNFHRFYPLVELNYTQYTFDGGARQLGYEGNNLFNFGSDGVAGHADLTLALGARYKFNENLQFGLAGEFSVLGGGRHIDGFRLTADVILRY
ncbi:MAG: transporter [Gemmataceae bacterium]|nr:transporter [Gemmataceae bacterium]